MSVTPDLTPLTTIPAANKVAGTDLLNSQKNDINSFNSAFSNYFNDPKNNLTSIAGNISNTLGLPTLQANANTINTQVANLPFTYRDATRGFDVNNNQLNRVVGQRITDLTPAMTTANNALTAGNEQFGRLTSQAQADIANRAIPFQSQQALLQDRMAREANMFTTENEQELNGLIAKINAGVTLSEGEATRANALAVAEKGYQNALDVAKQNQKYIPIPGYGVYDTTGNNGSGALLGGLSPYNNSSSTGATITGYKP